MGVINAILPIVTLLALGYVLKKIWIKNDDFWKTINSIIYYIMFPALIIKSIALADLATVNYDFIYVLIIILLSVVAVLWLFKPAFTSESFWMVFLQGSIRYNNYIFIAVALFYLGESALPIIALIIGFLVMMLNVISVVMLNLYSHQSKNITHMVTTTLFNPLVLACLLGLLINYIATFIPAVVQITWLNHTLGHLGTASLVLGLMAVGSALQFDVLRKHFGAVLLCSGIKLLVMPALVVAVLYGLNFDGVVILVCMLYGASPCSPVATALIQSMRGDYQSMSMMISVQTVLSLVTIPVLLYILGDVLL